MNLLVTNTDVFVATLYVPLPRNWCCLTKKTNFSTNNEHKKKVVKEVQVDWIAEWKVGKKRRIKSPGIGCPEMHQSSSCSFPTDMGIFGWFWENGKNKKIHKMGYVTSKSSFPPFYNHPFICSIQSTHSFLFLSRKARGILARTVSEGVLVCRAGERQRNRHSKDVGGFGGYMLLLSLIGILFLSGQHKHLVERSYWAKTFLLLQWRDHVSRPAGPVVCKLLRNRNKIDRQCSSSVPYYWSTLTWRNESSRRAWRR